MGGDGGTVANNRRFLPQAGFGVAKKEKDKATVDRERWSTCHLTKLPLRPPVLADHVGQVYSAEYVMTAMSKREKVAPYICSLKDLIKLDLQVVEEKRDFYESLMAGDDSLAAEEYLGLYQCPVTKQTTNGTNKFCCATRCKHVFSLKALQQMGEGSCPVCGADTVASFPEPGAEGADEKAEKPNVVVRLVPDLADVDRLGQAAATRQLAALERKQKKSGKRSGAALPAAAQKAKKARVGAGGAIPAPVPTGAAYAEFLGRCKEITDTK